MGKLFTKVIQVRLQKVAEKVLPDSQRGFRRDRGCVDMIYSARQLMEKTKEHSTKFFMLFVDLRKAYDSVPQQALWLVSQKYGIPPTLVNLIKSLHEDMAAEVRVDGATSPGIKVTNGLRQGCTIVPTLTCTSTWWLTSGEGAVNHWEWSLVHVWREAGGRENEEAIESCCD